MLISLKRPDRSVQFSHILAAFCLYLFIYLFIYLFLLYLFYFVFIYLFSLFICLFCSFFVMFCFVCTNKYCCCCGLFVSNTPAKLTLFLSIMQNKVTSSDKREPSSFPCDKIINASATRHRCGRQPCIIIIIIIIQDL